MKYWWQRTNAATWLVMLVVLLTARVMPRSISPINTSVTIVNQATATWQDGDGREYETHSPLVTIQVNVIAGVVVTPDDTQASALTVPNDHITRVFRVCNTGSAPDSFILTNAETWTPSRIASLYYDLNGDGAFTTGDTPVTLQATATPVLQPGECISVLAVVDTGAVATGGTVTISITARSTNTSAINGMPQDIGTIINRVGTPVDVSAPDNPSLPPIKLVENKDRITTSPGSVLTYSISFRNRGAVPARNVLLADDLPAELDYLPGTLKLGNRLLTDADDNDEGRVVGRRLEIKVLLVAPDEVVAVTFQARLNGSVVSGVGVINTATISGENIRTTTRTSEAVAVINPFGVVYAGYSGGSVRIPGARVLLAKDQEGNLPVTTSAVPGFAPNGNNENPFLTSQQGEFSFALTPAQTGTPEGPLACYLIVTAKGWRARLLAVTLRPQSGGLYEANIRALDGQPIAQAGSFALTEADVSQANLAALVMNIPLFESATLELTKIADRQQAEIGEMLSYRLEAHNAASVMLRDVTINDVLPPSFNYIVGSARIQVGGSPPYALDPAVSGNTLKFIIGQIGAGERVTITYRVRVGVNARQGEQVNVAVANAVFPNGTPATTQPARAAVQIGLGVFSLRQIILGRVFEDTNGNGLFDKGERPVAGARVYLNNGISVLTDSQGLYNIPSVEDGAAVVSLDPITVPKGFALLDNGLKSGQSWTRLLRTPLGGGALLRQNFALTKVQNPLENDIDLTGGSSAEVTGEAAVAKSNLAARVPSVPAVPNLPNVPVLAGTSTPAAKTASPESRPEAPATEKRGRRYNTRSKKTSTENIAPGVTEKIRPRGPRTRAGVMASKVDLKAGVYESLATETIEPVAPGDIQLLSPEPNEVILEPALRVEARVALDYNVALEIDGQRIPDSNIGVREVDRKNKVTTIVFVGLTLKPGPNKIRAIAIGPDNVPGRAAEISVMAPGQATSLSIVSDRKEIQSGGRAATLLRIKALDQWGNPAQAGQVMVEVSAGTLARIKDGRPERTHDDAALIAPEHNLDNAAESSLSTAQRAATQRQQIIPLEHGEAVIQLVAEGQAGNAEVRARMGDVQAETHVRFTPELRPQILVGLAEASVGKAAPENALRNEDRTVRHHTEFYFRGPLPKQTQLTLAYNSFRPLSRTAGRDRVFAFDPLDRVYPVFGDSSTRFEDAQSNAKLYARLDRGRSFAMFGDFDVSGSESLYTQPSQTTNLAENLASSAIGNNFRTPVFAGNGPLLTGYARRLTGVKLHLENAQGDALTVTGARPDTAFARDVFQGGTLSLFQLSHQDVLQGSETLVLEVRDRRNPEIILARETLARSVDYNLDADTGLVFLLRPVSTFDYALNLVQLVVMYEHRATGLSSAVYTARGVKSFERIGMRAGASFINQRQDQFGPYYLGGVDVEKKLPHKGVLQIEWGMSNGRVAAAGNLSGIQPGFASQEHNGNAVRAELRQPLPYGEGVIQAVFQKTDRQFFNPFGGTVAPGSQRANVAVDLKPRKRSQMRIGFTDERNQTATYHNNRQTLSLGWVESISDKLRVSIGYDYRHFTDISGSVLGQPDSNEAVASESSAPTNVFSRRSVTSHLLTVGTEYHPTNKLELAIRREQNLGDPDPTYPSQTTIAAGYRISSLAKLFLTQRLASGAITPIGDFGGSGFAATSSRRETALGIETRVGRYTSLTSRYQIENAISGNDSFAVIGLQNRLPINKQVSLDLGYERGLHLAGNGQSFNNAALGFTWLPTDRLRSAARYELRDQSGFGNVLTIGTAGKIKENLTALGRWQFARTRFEQRDNRSVSGQAALAWRPLESDRTAFLFSYLHRSLQQSGQTSIAPLKDRADIVATDGLFQATRRLELYGRFALKFSENGRPDAPLAGTLTTLYQGRAEYRFISRFDLTGEARMLRQTAGSQRNAFGSELGFWALPDLRVAGGYSFTRAAEPYNFTSPGFQLRRGFYFVISSKLSHLFDLFGTSRQGLVTADSPGAPTGNEE